MTIRFLDVGCGDCIHIRFQGNDGIFRNILIDGGVEQGDVYPKTLKIEVDEIITTPNEKIDLWIITHIDDDHIGGLLRLIKDPDFKGIDFKQTVFWYNYSNYDYDTGLRASNLKSVRQAMRLRDHLQENGSVSDFITDVMGAIDFFGARFTILSPPIAFMEKYIEKLKNEEIKIRQRTPSSLKMGGKHDYNVRIGDFDMSNEVEDMTDENYSSIALLVEYKNEAMLLTADSNPNVLANAIAKITHGNKLKLKYMQVPHHGSRYNLSNRLLDFIDCNEYVISADGFNKHNLPNKETLVKILLKNAGKPVIFHITQQNDMTKSIFNVDADEKINIRFPETGENYLEFRLG